MQKIDQNSLIEIIDRTNQLIKQAEMVIKNDFKIILLVGNTGAGKSTIFNLLCGAEFEIEQKGNRKELAIKKGTKNYSLMKGGTQSITKEPIYHFNEKYNHLIIDFPGFKDTGGEVEQLIVQLLFNQIVTNRRMKLLYVIQQPLLELPNRGAFIQEFIQQFQQQQVKFHQCVLIINNFALDEYTDAQVIKDERQQLFTITQDPRQHLQQIIVFRYINENKLHIMDQIYKIIWENILLALEIELFPLKIEKTDGISNFITQTCNNLIYLPCKNLRENIEAKLQKYDKLLLQEMSDILKQVIFNDKELVSDQLQKILKLLDKFNLIIFGCVFNETDEVNNFIIILDFFQDYSEFIVGYENFQNLLDQSINILSIIENTINIKLHEINKDLEIKQLIEEQNKIMQLKLLEQQEQFKKQLKEISEQDRIKHEQDLKKIQQNQQEKVQQLQQQIQKKKKKQKCVIF